MNVRPLLLAALALGFAAGCSKPTASSSAPPPSEPGTAAAPAEGRPTEAAPPPGEPGTAPAAAPSPSGEGAGAKAGASTVYIVRNSGVRCITTPCPYFLATPADKPNTDAIQVHELDLSAVTGGSDERQQSLLQQTEVGEGLRLEGSLETQPNAGPAGAATILRAKKVDG